MARIAAVSPAASVLSYPTTASGKPGVEYLYLSTRIDPYDYV